MKNVPFRRNKPISAKNFFIRIIISKHTVRKRRLPDRPFHVLPTCNPLRAFDDHLLSLGRTVNDTVKFTGSAILRFYPFPVFSGMYNDRISWSRKRCSSGNCCKGILCTTFIAVAACDGHMIFSPHMLPPNLCLSYFYSVYSIYYSHLKTIIEGFTYKKVSLIRPDIPS